jgi:hypothetical protein
MVTCFNDPEKVMTSAFEHLNPGGWIEYQDSSMPIYDFYGGAGGKCLVPAKQRLGFWIINDLLVNLLAGSGMEIWNKHFDLGAAAIGRDMKRASQYKQRLIDTGCK